MAKLGPFDKINNEIIFRIPRPIMWDAVNVYSDDLSYNLKIVKGGYEISIVINEVYLNDINRVYPVTIDPDIIIENDRDDMTYLDSGKPTTNFIGENRMDVGFYKKCNFMWLGYNWHKRSSLVKFMDIDGEYVTNENTILKSAKLVLESSDNNSETSVIHVKINKWENMAKRDERVVCWNAWDPTKYEKYIDNDDLTRTGVLTLVKGESVPRYYSVILDNYFVKCWMIDDSMNNGLSLIPASWTNTVDNLKQFSNAWLDITISEEISATVNTSYLTTMPQTVKFATTTTPTSLYKLTYSWDFDVFNRLGDNITSNSNELNPVYGYSTPGTYLYRLTITGTPINTSLSPITKIVEGTVSVKPSTISINYGSSLDPQNLRFTVDETEPSTSTKFLWEFGDGSFYNGREGWHKYAREGTYNVRVTISDTTGNSVVLKRVLKFYEPKILVHGFNDDFGCWTEQINYLRAIVYNGTMNEIEVTIGHNFTQPIDVHTVYNFDYYRIGDSESTRYLVKGKIGPINTIKSLTSSSWTDGNMYNDLTHSYSKNLQTMVEKICAITGFSKVDIVAHSMGGIVARTYIKYYGGNSRVDSLLTIGTPNHGIRSIDRWAANLADGSQAWQNELEVREMEVANNTFYKSDNFSYQRAFIELLNGEDSIGLTFGLTGCNGNEVIGPTRYATIIGRDDGEIDIPLIGFLVEPLWEIASPSDGVVEHYSVPLHGPTVDANIGYPGVHSRGTKGAENKTELQIIPQTPFVSSYINAWMHQKRTVNVETKPVARVEQITYRSPVITAYTGATKDNAIWVWVMLQHVQSNNEPNPKYAYTVDTYNSFWKDLTNETSSNEVVFDLSTAHYTYGDNLRITVITYGTNGYKVEHFPVTVSSNLPPTVY